MSCANKSRKVLQNNNKQCVLLNVSIVDLQTSLSHAEMLRLYRSANVYVSSFRSEGFGLGTLEALALGLQASYQSTTDSVDHTATHTCG